MAEVVLSWLLAIPLLGFVTGLRTMTPLAVLCWFAYSHALSLEGTWAVWAGRRTAVILFTILAIVEIVLDKHPKTPSRLKLAPLIARLFFGGMLGSIVAAGLNGSGLEGALLGILGATAGSICGFFFRKEITERTQYEDWQIAVSEDALAIGLALFALGVITS
jgi:uncharacterized membrane protein